MADFRDELLNETLFNSLEHARAALAAWKDDYNTVRPHGAISNLPPAAYAKLSVPEMQRDGALRSTRGFAPHPVAPPSPIGSNAELTLLVAGWKRGSRQHLHRYLAEYDFRYNTRTALGFNDGKCRACS